MTVIQLFYTDVVPSISVLSQKRFLDDLESRCGVPTASKDIKSNI